MDRAMHVCAGAAFAALIAIGPAAAQTPQTWKWCEGQDAASIDLRISGCTAAIEAGRESNEISPPL
jgi:hypothetical protein